MRSVPPVTRKVPVPLTVAADAKLKMLPVTSKFEVVPMEIVPPVMVVAALNCRSPENTEIVPPVLLTGTLNWVTAEPVVFWIVPLLLIELSVPPP
jgi:hypothetical protein